MLGDFLAGSKGAEDGAARGSALGAEAAGGAPGWPRTLPLLSGGGGVQGDLGDSVSSVDSVNSDSEVTEDMLWSIDAIDLMNE